MKYDLEFREIHSQFVLRKTKQSPPHANIVSYLSAKRCSLPVLKAVEWLHRLWENARGVWRLVCLRGL